MHRNRNVWVYMVLAATVLLYGCNRPEPATRQQMEYITARQNDTAARLDRIEAKIDKLPHRWILGAKQEPEK